MKNILTSTPMQRRQYINTIPFQRKTSQKKAHSQKHFHLQFFSVAHIKSLLLTQKKNSLKQVSMLHSAPRSTKQTDKKKKNWKEFLRRSQLPQRRAAKVHQGAAKRRSSKPGSNPILASTKSNPTYVCKPRASCSSVRSSHERLAYALMPFQARASSGRSNRGDPSGFSRCVSVSSP